MMKATTVIQFDSSACDAGMPAVTSGADDERWPPGMRLLCLAGGAILGWALPAALIFLLWR